MAAHVWLAQRLFPYNCQNCWQLSCRDIRLFKRGPRNLAFDAGGVNRGMKPLAPSPAAMEVVAVRSEEADSEAEVLSHNNRVRSGNYTQQYMQTTDCAVPACRCWKRLQRRQWTTALCLPMPLERLLQRQRMWLLWRVMTAVWMPT